MRTRTLCGLSASLALLPPLVSACDADAGKPATGATRPMMTTSAAPVATTTSAVAAPLTTQGARTVKWIDLQTGDCLADPPPSDPSVVTVTTVDCVTAHHAEVYLRAPIAVNEAVADVASRTCDAGFTQYTGRIVDVSAFTLTYLIDSDQDRTSSNPTPSTVICLLQAATGQPLVGSQHH